MEKEQVKFVSKEDQVSVSFASELMSNYFPESNIEGSREIRTFMVGPDQSLIFYQDQQEMLKAILRKEGSESGWIPFSLSEDAVRSYEFEFNPKKGTFQLAKVEGNQVWVSQALVVKDTDFEQLDQVIQWRKIHADSFSETIDKVSIGTRHVLFGTSAEKSDALFYLADLNDLKPVSYTFPEHAKRIVQFELGTYAKSSGVFFLYEIGQERTMLFQSFEDEETGKTDDVRFESEESFNCFALLETSSGNHMLYAAGNQVHEYKGPEKGEYGKHAVLPGTYDQIQKIRVASYDQERTVWAMDKQGLFYQTNRFFDQSSQGFQVGQWTNPLLMVEGVAQFSCAKGNGIRNQLYAISTEYGSELTRLWQDSVTTLWNTNKVTLSNMDSLKEVASYSAQVRFSTATSLRSFQGQKVSLSADSNIFVYVDSQSYHLGPAHQVEISLGLVPEFTIICPVEELGAANIHLTADFLQGEELINLSGKALDRLQDKIEKANGLGNVKNSKGKPLVPAGVQPDAVQAAQAGISQMISAGSSMDKKAAPVLNSSSFRVQGAVSAGVSAPTVESFFVHAGHSLGDFLHTVWSKAKEAFEFVMEKVADGFKFIIKIGEQVFNWIVKTLREIGSFIQRVFEAIGVFFKDLFDFLAFLFDWHAILETKRAYKGFVENAIVNLRGELVNIRKFIDATLEKEIEKFSPELVSIPKDIASVNVSESPKESSPDPRSNWLNSKKQYLDNGKTKGEGKKMPTELSDVFESLMADLIPIVQETGKGLLEELKIVADEFSNVIHGKLSFGEFLKIAMEKLAGSGLFILKQLMDVILRSLESLVEVAFIGLTQPWNVPIISPIYEEFSEGDKLTFLDLMCLFVAIPSTILFKIGENQAPFESEEVKDAFIARGKNIFQLT
ncbi:hypothetical protein [Algoriphagus vanfongensis]|uniref:hypothetical protein n=1 Tax=Algoriphagus vanfongensis TaxID=426371 RepID=UPI000409C23B|nr:hypothetical protein [Algoriphagus vanfongensis]